VSTLNTASATGSTDAEASGFSVRAPRESHLNIVSKEYSLTATELRYRHA
jgi:hypothetical protein